MITDNQVRQLQRLSQGKSLEVATARSGLYEKTWRKYRDMHKLPSDIQADKVRNWYMRRDPFTEIWPSVVPFLKMNAGLEA